MSDSAQSLLSEFPEHTYEQWHAAAEALLKGAPFEKLLVSKTYEEITIQPIYRREDITGLEHRKQFPGSGSLVRGSRAGGFLKAGWEVSQELSACKPEKLNTLIHDGLNGGQSELNITKMDPLRNLADITTAFREVAVDAISTSFRSGADSLAIAALYFAAARKSGLDFKSLRAAFDNDPLADLVTNGSLKIDLSTRFDHIAALTDYAAKNAPGIRTITVQGDIYHNAGATATQELGYITASLVSYIEEMKARGLSPGSVFPHIRLRLAIGSDYFMEIAKIRAARSLWSMVAAAYGVENAPVQIHASTSQWNKTTYDAHTNMLRVTAEAFAAVVGGVDSLHIGPYDEISGHTDEFSRRIARNLHTILREECGLDQVIDPAGGSTYIEWLTDQIASKSWGIFQEIEKTGGMLASLQDGTVQQAVDAVCKAKFQNIRRRKDKIVGSNMYPNLKAGKLRAGCGNCCQSQNTAPEQPIARFKKSALVEQAINAALDGATVSQITSAASAESSEAITITPLQTHRAAEEYEALRDASAAFAAKTGSAPSILQLNIGPSGRYRLRADWTASFFEAAGFAVDGTRDFKSHEDAIAALIDSSANIAVITSDDATYQQTVESLANAVKVAKPTVTLLVAGAPGESEATWRAAGVDEFVNVRSNNYELNQQLLKKAGV